jgi:bifunctional aspartokinase / homoserine dehydrogenase 1
MPATAARTRQALLPMMASGRIPVVTGYIGAAPSGATTTLGRGGSDYSAAIMAVALQASEVWIWTDVDGVMTADPRMVPNARTISMLSYREVAEMAHFGAKVLHPKSIHPVIEAGILLRVCNTFNPYGPNTQLVNDAATTATG